MYPGDTSQATIGNMNHEQIQTAGDVHSEPPSFGSTGHGEGDSNKFQDPTAGMADSTNAPSFAALNHGQGDSYNKFQGGLDQTDGTGDSTEAPSFIGLNHGDGNSYNKDGGSSYRNGAGGQPPSIGAMVQGRVSQPWVADPDTEDKAPSRSDLNPREPSQPGRSLDVFDDSDPQQNSVVRRKFKRLYPTTYYKEKDGED